VWEFASVVTTRDLGVGARWCSERRGYQVISGYRWVDNRGARRGVSTTARARVQLRLVR
jgi:hypothetical protein